MLIYLLERLRKFLKSVGKKEEKINDLITLIKYKNQSNFSKIIDENYDPITQISNSFKLAAVIGFFYDENKLATLFEVCESLEKITNENEIYILTNTKSSIHQEKIKKGLNEKVKIIPINEIVHNRLLPKKWSFSTQKKSEISHLEPNALDDLKKRQVKAITDDQLAGLSQNQVQKADDFIEMLSNKQLQTLAFNPSIDGNNLTIG